jgi:DNA-binding transcriptional MocR family regulator
LATKPRFTLVRDGVVEHHKKMTWPEIGVFHHLLSRATRNQEYGAVGLCRGLGSRAVAEDMGKDRNTVRRAMQGLEAARYIKRTSEGVLVLNFNGNDRQIHQTPEAERPAAGSSLAATADPLEGPPMTVEKPVENLWKTPPPKRARVLRAPTQGCLEHPPHGCLETPPTGALSTRLKRDGDVRETETSSRSSTTPEMAVEKSIQWDEERQELIATEEFTQELFAQYPEADRGGLFQLGFRLSLWLRQHDRRRRQIVSVGGLQTWIENKVREDYVKGNLTKKKGA